MASRIQISKKLRFDVFKRDFFKCQYCGSFPPEVILEVDHIQPHSKGGKNDINNLITSCFNCNRGKSDNELNQIPNSLSENIDIVKEKLYQYKQFKKLNSEILKSIQSDIDSVETVFNNYFEEYGCSNKFKNGTIKMFIEQIGVIETIDSMHIACCKGLNESNTLKYFCGVCHNKIRNK